MTSEVKSQTGKLTCTDKLKYQTCRENVGLTQSEACYHLDIKNVETLSRYENGHATPPDDVIYKMAILYRIKNIVTWHLRLIHPDLAEFIPYPDELHSEHEMALNLEFMADKTRELESVFKDYLRDGVLCDEEKAKLKDYDVPEIQRIIDGLTAIKMFAEKI